MKEIATSDALGHVLCHDITRIVVGETKETAFRKGHIVTAEDIPKLLSLGKEKLYIWERQPGMLHENEAAEILYEICAAPGMSPTPVREGKIEVLADHDGLLQIDIEGLRRVNTLGELMIATRLSNRPVRRGERLAGTRIIPLVISAEKMEQARLLAGPEPLLKLLPYQSKKIGLIVTGNEVFKGRIKDSFTPVLERKLAEYPTEIMDKLVLDDNPAKITEAILRLLNAGADMILCTGGMSVDPDDRTPLAIRNSGVEVVSYGAPVLPGAMFLLSYTASGVPVLGLPGCVMYEKKTIFDLILPRLMAGLRVKAEDLAALGHGGLCLNCEHCIFPNCGFGCGV